MHYGNGSIRTDLRPQSASGSSPEMLVACTESTNDRVEFCIALWAGPSIAILIDGPPSGSCEGGSFTPVLQERGGVSERTRDCILKSENCSYHIKELPGGRSLIVAQCSRRNMNAWVRTREIPPLSATDDHLRILIECLINARQRHILIIDTITHFHNSHCIH